MITIEQLQEMFTNMREHTDWDVDGELLWGYFFTDADPDKLEKAAEALDEMGYDVVEIFQSEDDEDPSITDFVLHVERIEPHTPQSLFDRNNELIVFAEKQGIESFDGVDVGSPFDDDDEEELEDEGDEEDKSDE
jgi:regulator of RNase E activity RraB